MMKKWKFWLLDVLVGTSDITAGALPSGNNIRVHDERIPIWHFTKMLVMVLTLH
jgi:hypothetical protein